MLNDHTPSPEDNSNTPPPPILSQDRPRIEEDELSMDNLLRRREECGDGETEDISRLARIRKPNPFIQGCNSIENYLYLNKIHEGSYGIVFRAKDRINGLEYAIKNIKVERNNTGFPVSSLREINMLMGVDHPNIVRVREVVTGGRRDKIYVVMEYIENELKHLIEIQGVFSLPAIKCLMRQLLEGIEYLHRRHIVHRDLKSSNLLLNKQGILKICDFGLSRPFATSSTPYSPLAVTLWYRSPELLLGCPYTEAVDMWSIGCLLAELFLGEAIWKGKAELEQLEMIVGTLGFPGDSVWPAGSEWFKKRGLGAWMHKNSNNRLAERFSGVNGKGEGSVINHQGFDLLTRLLHWDPRLRISAKEALGHSWFREHPLPCLPSEIPQKASLNEKPRDYSHLKPSQKA